jgi:hypothetical protein
MLLVVAAVLVKLAQLLLRLVLVATVVVALPPLLQVHL